MPLRSCPEDFNFAILILVAMHSFYESHVFCAWVGAFLFLFPVIAFIVNVLVFLIHPLILFSSMFAPYGF